MEGIKLRAASVIFLVAVFLMGVAAVASPLARAEGCTVTVTASSSIQAAVDAAGPGDEICLSGTFTGISTVLVGTSGITLTTVTAATIAGGGGPAFRLADGVSDVKIENLEISGRTGFRGGGIEAWDVSTSDITVENNWLHDNSYSGVLVGSEGGFVHTDWTVENNVVDDHGFAGIELTNCGDCSIEENTLSGNGFANIVVQARNTVAGSSLVAISDVKVEDNTMTGGFFGIYVISYEGLTGFPFSSIGASSLLTGVKIEGNTVTDATVAGIIFRGFNPGGSAIDSSIEENAVNCATSSGSPSILVLKRPIATPGTVTGVSLEENVIDTTDCAAPFADPGTG